MRTALATKLLLWLFVIDLGVALGAGLYEARVMLPQWLTFSPQTGYAWDPDAAREANTGLRFWLYVTTGPLTLLTIAGGIMVWRTRGAVRQWWLIALGAELVERTLTMAYFIPTMIRLTNDPLPAHEAVETAHRWASLNSIRHILVAIALVAALKAFAAFYSGIARKRELNE